MKIRQLFKLWPLRMYLKINNLISPRTKKLIILSTNFMIFNSLIAWIAVV